MFVGFRYTVVEVLVSSLVSNMPRNNCFFMVIIPSSLLINCCKIFLYSLENGVKMTSKRRVISISLFFIIKLSFMQSFKKFHRWEFLK